MAEVEIPLSRVAPRDLLRVLFKRGRAIALFYGGSLLAAVLYCFFWPPTYEASVRLLLEHNREEPVIAADQDSVRTISRRAVTESDLNDETEIVRSASVIEKTTRDLDLEHLPPHWLLRLARLPFEGVSHVYDWYHGKAGPDAFTLAARRLRDRVFVIPAKKSAILEVRVRWGDRGMAERILSTLQANYLAHRGEVTKAPDTRDFFLAQAEVKRRALEQIDERLDAIQPGASLDSIRLAQDLVGRQVAEFDSQWRRARTGRAEAGAAERADGESMTETSPRIVYEEKPLFSDQALGALKARVLELRLRRTELLQKYQPTSRLVRQTEEELSQAESLLGSELAAPPALRTTNVNNVSQGLDERRLLERSRAAGHEALARATQRELTQLEDRLDRLNRQSVAVRVLDRERRAAEQAYVEYLKRAEDARVYDQINRHLTLDVRAIEPVRAGFTPVKPNSRLILKLALGLGLLLAIGLAFLVEQLDHRVLSERDIESFYGLPVITTFDQPAGDAGTSERGLRQLRGGRPSSRAPWIMSSAARDQLRKVRATVCPAGGGVASLALCSHDAGEGVSWVASRLACVVAEEARRVVLLDANSARPAQRELFGIRPGEPPAEGSGTSLRVWPTRTRHLEIGLPEPAPAEATDGEASLAPSLEQARGRAEVVIVDCEPFGGSAQVLNLRGVVDGVLLVVQAERKRREVVGRMLEALHRVQIPVVGAVITQRRQYIPSFLYRRL
jgi:uncharacterized protein involved in exopolysaccharide biosynthesis/Mrp family chromosome partitioning ATPase